MQQQQPPPYSAQQPQVVTVQQPSQITTVVVGTNNQERRPGAWKTILGTGIAQLVLGALTAILGIVNAAASVIYDGSTPIWTGLCFYSVAGILGILAGRTKTTCPTIGYMVMSILACLATTGVMTSASILMTSGCGSFYNIYYGYGCNDAGIVTVNAILLFMAISEFVISIIGASSTCGAVCCTKQPSRALHYYPNQGQAMVVQPQIGVAQPGVQVVQQVPPMAYQLQPQPQPASAPMQ